MAQERAIEDMADTLMSSFAIAHKLDTIKLSPDTLMDLFATARARELCGMNGIACEPSIFALKACIFLVSSAKPEIVLDPGLAFGYVQFIHGT